MVREGLLVVVSGPSGAGKGTVLNLLKAQNENIVFSISATTRKPREGEIDGKNYFFKTVETFQEMLNKDEMLEWVKYCDNYYGTPRKYVEDNVKQGKDVLLEIEVNGALKIKQKFPESVLAFILPPSFEELKKRLEGRGTESLEVIEKRLETARDEMVFIDKYDYILVNDSVDTAVCELNSILISEKLKYYRNKGMVEQMGFKLPK